MSFLFWQNTVMFSGKNFACGYCHREVAPNQGFMASLHESAMPSGQVSGPSVGSAFIYICANCRQPTYVDPLGQQTPGSSFGAPVSDVPADTSSFYDEVRRCMSVSAYTSAVLGCRKLLMHIAVEQGAAPGRNFVEYVTYLEDNHYTPPGSKVWVDQIRVQGNEANHTITIMAREAAENLISFCEMILKFVYEFPKRAKP
jgi:hypothetical protein